MAPVRTATPGSVLAPADRALSGGRLLAAEPAPPSSLTAPRGPRFMPGPNAPKLPQISLRGLARNTRKAAALLEVEGQGVFVVRADETFTISVGTSTATLRVVSIESGSVVLEAPSLSGKVVVR